MSGKRNVSVCSGHELANALYGTPSKAYFNSAADEHSFTHNVFCVHICMHFLCVGTRIHVYRFMPDTFYFIYSLINGRNGHEGQ